MWLKEHGLLNGSMSTPERSGGGKGGWLHEHELLNHNDTDGSMGDLFKTSHVSMFDYFDEKSSPDVKMGDRSHYANGGNVETMDTTPSWAQGAPANSAREAYSTGGRVGRDNEHSNAVFDGNFKTKKEQPYIEWTGYFGTEKC